MDKLRNWYRIIAFSVFNSLALFVVLNLSLYLVISLRTRPEGPLARYGKGNILTAHPGWREQDLDTLLRETYIDLGFEYEPFTEFRNKPLRGQFVNVDPAGFRLSKNQAPWPPRPENFNVFVFGGSTAFGMGLADNETIASYLQDVAHKPNMAVYNFGRIFYLSRQEEILFQQLLQAGFAPQVAVFVDGLNDFLFPDGGTGFSPRFRQFMAGQEDAGPLNKIPMVKAAHWLRDRGTSQPRSLGPEDFEHWVGQKVATETKSGLLEGVVTRWLANKQMIELMAKGFGVRTIFVWQPVPVYKYDLAYHRFSHDTFVRKRGRDTNREALLENLIIHGKLGPDRILGMEQGYALMGTLRAQDKLGSDVLWLADLQQDRQENLYVDAVHYTAAFSKEIAEKIGSAMQ
jgi:hypothetical protein